MCLIGLKVGITYVDSHNYTKIKIDSVAGLLLEKTLIIHNAVIHIKSIFNKITTSTTIKRFKRDACIN